jgi:hypothetical protein
MLAKGEKGVNGKCVLVCTKLEKEWTIFAQLTALLHFTADSILS